MKKLELKKAAFDVAFATATAGAAAMDAATASKASELNLPDPQYQQFRNDVLFFRQPLLAAYQADQLEAAKAKTAPANQTAAKLPGK